MGTPELTKGYFKGVEAGLNEHKKPSNANVYDNDVNMKNIKEKPSNGNFYENEVNMKDIK